MAQDPIVGEIHRIREQLWKECHGSADQMAARQQRWQQRHPDSLVDPGQWERRHKTKKRKSA